MRFDHLPHVIEARLRTIHHDETLWAISANEYEAEMLGLEVGAPLMLIESTTYLEDGRPIDYFRARHRGDLTRFIVESFKYASREQEATDLRAALQTI